MAPGKRIQVT